MPDCFAHQSGNQAQVSLCVLCSPEVRLLTSLIFLDRNQIPLWVTKFWTPVIRFLILSNCVEITYLDFSLTFRHSFFSPPCNCSQGPYLIHCSTYLPVHPPCFSTHQLLPGTKEGQKLTPDKKPNRQTKHHDTGFNGLYLFIPPPTLSSVEI
ncbi:hypothetical protein CHARACLAT_022061 [Characodon lateralis]|uniref:Uncharacterized protein n=1 Tax=Characodon lateralis TaxID=208331 RepID=A0ABU7ED59_9TELE|nr:hypothetical protein [Characodon lateralis]